MAQKPGKAKLFADSILIILRLGHILFVQTYSAYITGRLSLESLESHIITRINNLIT